MSEQPSTQGLADQAWELHQWTARADYLGEAGQVERDLGSLALVVAVLAEKVAALESNQEDRPS